MNRKMGRLTAGLMAATLAVSLGGCGGEREGEQREGQRGAQRTTTEITMATLAGEWGFEAQELREAIRRGVKAEYRVPGMPADQAPELVPEDIEVIDMMTEELSSVRFTLNADGTMTVVGENLAGGDEREDGTWELNNRNILIKIRDLGEPINGRVIDNDTMEIDFEDIGDFDLKVMLRRQS